MALARPSLSIIVPTRHRTAWLRELLDSLAAQARLPDRFEVVLVVDADDDASIAFRHPGVHLSHVVVSPGQTMGALNMAGYRAARGDYVMLLNDDVIARTPGWNTKVFSRLERFPDGIVLVHVNDTLQRENLCTFPIVTRTFCELAGGICPTVYARYRIDDHIEDIFNLLGCLGRKRTIYLPDVVFEHRNSVRMAGGALECHPVPDLLALDAPRFLELFPARKRLALKLLEHMEGPFSRAQAERLRHLLDGIEDPFALRVGGRQLVESDEGAFSRLLRFLRRQGRKMGAMWQRSCRCYREKGNRGLWRAIQRRWAK